MSAHATPLLTRLTRHMHAISPSLPFSSARCSPRPARLFWCRVAMSDVASDDDGEFAYFLPSGIEIEDDAEEQTYQQQQQPFKQDNTQQHQSIVGSSSYHPSSSDALPPVVDDSYSFVGSHLSGGWQSQSHTAGGVGGSLTNGANTQQQSQVAMLAAMQRENARQIHQQHHHQPHTSYSTTRDSDANALLAALYGPNSSSHYTSANTGYNSASLAPSHQSSSSSFSSSLTPLASSPPPVDSTAASGGYNAQQLQFFQQLQLYQQQLQYQQQSSSHAAVGVGGSSHYTKAPPGLSYDGLDEKPINNNKTFPMADLNAPDRSRRRPLPHHSHTNVTIMNRPPNEERETALTQPKTTVVTTGGAAGTAPSVLPSSSWGSGHTGASTASPYDSSHSHKSSYVKHIPASVVASSKTEKWPSLRAATVKPTNNTTATNNEEKTPDKKKTSGVAITSATSKTSAAHGKSSIPPKRIGPPAATIRHIESEAPVPLTATEMAGLNAHLRKAASHLTSDKSLVEGPSAPIPSIPPPAAAAATLLLPKRTHRHDHPKFQPGPKALPNDNVFDFLGEADPDEIVEEDARTNKRAGKKAPKQEKKTDEEQTSTNDEDQDDDEEEEDEDEDDDGEDDEVAKDTSSDVDEEADDDDVDDEDEDEEDEDEAELVDEDDTDQEGVGVHNADDASSSSSSASSPRVSPPISPTTGLPVAPILRSPTASSTAPSHSRRVSFQQPQSKKQSAAAKVKEQPQAAAAAPASTPDDDAANAAIESVTGLRKRGKKDKKIANKPAPIAQTAAAKESDEEEEEESLIDTPEVTPSNAKMTGLPVFLSFLSALMSQYVASCSRSLSSRSFHLASHWVGVLMNFLWSLVCAVARLHRHAANVISTDHQMAFCFTFLYLFPYLVHHMMYWAPPWAAPCLWYAFLMQVFCSTQGSPVLVGLFRILLPLLFLTEGVSHHTFLLELNGAERLVIAFVLSSFKTQEYYRPMFLFALALQIITSLFYGNHVLTQWSLLIVSLLVIHERHPSSGLTSSNPAFTPSKGKQLSSSLSAAIANEPMLTEATNHPTQPAASAPPPANSSWMGNMFGGGGMTGAFNRRTRAKASVQKARRTGRF